MSSESNETWGLTAPSSSRRVYLLRRLAGGMLLFGVILLFFKGTTLWSDLCIIALGIVVWLIAGWIEGRHRRRNGVECDGNGNAVKKVL